MLNSFDDKEDRPSEMYVAEEMINTSQDMASNQVEVLRIPIIDKIDTVRTNRALRP
jgi:hypothetical protein